MVPCHDSYQAIITSEHRFRFSCRLRFCSSHPSCLDCVRSRRKIMCCPNASATLNGAQKAFPILSTDLYCLERGCLQFRNFRAFSVHSEPAEIPEFSEFKKVQNKKLQLITKRQHRWPATQQDKTKEHENYKNSLCSRCCTYPGILDAWETRCSAAQSNGLCHPAQRDFSCYHHIIYEHASAKTAPK
jgi:hypothetical protein